MRFLLKSSLIFAARMSSLAKEGLKPVETLIHSKIISVLSPSHVEIVNESFKHNVPKGSESHFKVLVVSDVFEGKSLVERHRMVNHCLGEELKSSIHALSIQAKTNAQWEASAVMHTTPNCLGGDKTKH